MDSPRRDDRSIRETVAATLADHPVSVGFLFGSRARGEVHDRSDVDVAVAFEDTDPGEPGHVDAHLRLGADLALALGTDVVDVVDLQAASPSLVRAVFRDGDRLVGSTDDAGRLREALLDDSDAEADHRSPAERFDDALAAIDDHLA
ncbi:type VII toxin-antitoxin system MntA family adenylyltransferase antitoxin [Halalkaliarchaeum desulfuricum]|uniref:type VII toxin-antitoxin system MntA family adenylyltransferase antitoxin n=1 Tax=Halalkaliarchaeum desulfuricum TaxID=2055893 RepID=UPI000E6C7CFA|nr:nucleotidyltransferase domain-containing protein [Halalkaliarchaeum desulfuricum]